MLGEEEFLLPDPESPDSEAFEPDFIEGLSLRMIQAMNHYQREECRCFVCGATNYFARDCLHQETFHTWHKEHLNSKGAGPQQKVPTPKSPPQKCTHCNNTLHFFTVCQQANCTLGGPETLVSLWVKGRQINALADSGSQVNTVTPSYVCQHEFPVLLLHDLVDHPLNLIGLGGTRTCPLSFVIP